MVANWQADVQDSSILYHPLAPHWYASTTVVVLVVVSSPQMIDA
jgi:hypothetical protein